MKPLQNPEKIPRAKSRKYRNPGDRDWDLKIPKNFPRKFRKKPEWKIPKIPKSPGFELNVVHYYFTNLIHKFEGHCFLTAGSSQAADRLSHNGAASSAAVSLEILSQLLHFLGHIN